MSRVEGAYKAVSAANLGAQLALQENLKSYLKLVKRVASHFRGRLPAAIELSDLVQAGTVGLMEALSAFDSEKGTDFETFAKLRIRGAMLDEIRKNSWAPRSTVKIAVQAREAAERITEKTGAVATHRQIAEAIGLDLSKFEELRGRNQGVASTVSVDEVDFATDALGPAELVEQEDLINSLKKNISFLSERERLILALYYDEELTLKEIGAVLEVSESRVSQILSAVAKKLAAAVHVDTNARIR